MSMTVDVPVDVEAGPAALLKVLAEPMRWEIVRRLAAEDLCTCHLVEDLGAAQPLVSHHLKVLREAGVVHPEPCGSYTYYILDPGALAGLAAVLAELAGGRDRACRRPCS